MERQFMQNELTVAAIQMNAHGTREENLAKAIHLVEQAAAAGAQLIVLPELFNGYGDLANVVAQAETIPGRTSEALRACAVRHGVWLLGGSLCEQADQPDRGYNTSLFFNPQGEIIAKYRKLHLFEVEIPGFPRACESDHMCAGDNTTVLETALGTCGIAICYDLRFPELFRELAASGLELLLFPSAFTPFTGRAHWEILLRARAIENQCYVVAANQCGRHDAKVESYGHSLIIDPWGDVLAAADEAECFITARLTAARLREIRSRLPALKNRRTW
jgi:deaminated glutathione amidase